MSLKHNVIYSELLTVSLYILQFVTFPYVTRVLGPAGVGTCNYFTGILNFFIQLSGIGIPILGIREIARVKKFERNNLNAVFSKLLLLNAIFVIIAIVALIITGLVANATSEDWKYFGVIAITILLNLFNIEWLFRGLEEFRYITVRTVGIRLAFVISVFVFVKAPSDSFLYFLISSVSIIISALINWGYKNQFVKIRLTDLCGFRGLASAAVILGIYILVSGYYNTILPVLLGRVSTMEEVGFFSISSKLILFILLLLNAYTQAALPRIAGSYEGDSKILISNSFKLLAVFIFPITLFVFVAAPDILSVIVGKEYSGAILPMRISCIALLAGSLNQIISNHILIPASKDAAIINCFLMGVVPAIALFFIFPERNSVTCSVCWSLAELIILFVQLRCIKNLFSFDKYLLETLLKIGALSLSLLFIYPLNKALPWIYLRLCLDGILTVFILLMSYKLAKF